MSAIPSEVHSLCPVISCHSWNKDRTQLVICPNDNSIRIYTKSGTGWTKTFDLCQHDQVITGLDWAPETNRIVSCAQDRNAYVWNFSDNDWKPTLVILRINRAATDVKWSQDETKFAVSSASQCVPVCYFEKNNDWWVAKIIRKGHTSTVLSVCWHPNGSLIATGCADNKCRILSAHIKDVDTREPSDREKEFGTLLAEVETSGWVHSVCWSPSGSRLAFASHDSTLNVAEMGEDNSLSVKVLKLKDLPLVDISWIDENTIVGGGHDYSPYIFTCKNGDWNFARKLDSGSGGDGEKKAGGFGSALKMFQSQSKLGATENDTSFKTKHQNTITNVEIMERADGAATKLSTSGLDGKVVVWKLPSVTDLMSGCAL